LNKRFGTLNPPTFVTSVSRGAAITFSRLRLDCARRTFDAIPAEHAYSFHVNFLKQESFSASGKARAAERYFLGEGYSTMLDYSEAPTVTMHSPLDTVRLYVPRLTLQDFVREQYGSSEVHLKPRSVRPRFQAVDRLPAAPLAASAARQKGSGLAVNFR
jgi:hypothetical protein